MGDPLVRSSFLSAYANALALTARYEEALAAAEALQRTAEQFRFDFALPYGLCAAAMAHTGSRRWQEAEVAASKALSKSRASQTYTQNCSAALCCSDSTHSRDASPQGSSSISEECDMP